VRYRADRHHAERLLCLARARDSDIDAAMLRPHLYPADHERAAVDAVLATAPSRGPFIALAPGSVWATKRWPYYAEVARRIADRGLLVVIGSTEDRAAAREIVDATEGAAIDATGRLSLLASAELLSRCALLVTNDSAPQHLASAMGTPTITIFGPTVPEFGFGPLAPGSRIAGHPSLRCRPCHSHGPRECPLGHWRCMREVPAEDVAALAAAVLATPAA
jgi:heptosyltransferase-2